MISLDNVVKNGGASVDVNGNDMVFNCGYCVSLPGLFFTMPMDGITQDDVDSLYARVCDIITAGNLAKTHFAGAWIDNGLFYMGISTRIANRDDAELFGKAGNQIAIFNFKKMEDIVLDYSK